jgi:hypothetical protein
MCLWGCTALSRVDLVEVLKTKKEKKGEGEHVNRCGSDQPRYGFLEQQLFELKGQLVWSADQDSSSSFVDII